MYNIVLIEDSSLMRMRIVKILQQNGNFSISDFKAADDIARTPQSYLAGVNLIITDIWLPGISGIDLCKALSKNPQCCKIPVIFMSAYSDAKTIHEAINAGAADYIAKPFDDQLLVDKVKRVLGDPLLSECMSYMTSAGNLKEVINAECERADRGHQPLSVIKLSVSKNDVPGCTLHIKNIIRKIDMIFILQQNIIILLPLTDEKGTNVVYDKICSRLTENSIEILDKNMLTYTPGIPLSVNEIMKALL